MDGNIVSCYFDKYFPAFLGCESRKNRDRVVIVLSEFESV
jgi:hypothetical protein